VAAMLAENLDIFVAGLMSRQNHSATGNPTS